MECSDQFGHNLNNKHYLPNLDVYDNNHPDKNVNLHLSNSNYHVGEHFFHIDHYILAYLNRNVRSDLCDLYYFSCDNGPHNNNDNDDYCCDHQALHNCFCCLWFGVGA